MEEYGKILNYAIPIFLLLIAIEYGASCFKQLKVYRLFDTVSSLSSGMTNIIKDVLGLSIVIISYTWMFDHLAIMKLESTIMIYLLAFVGLDFAGYWSHRFSHEINVFWNRHIIHHSSEEFNLACALRQSVSEIFAVFTILFLPMALLGVPPMIVAVVAPLHLFGQFWYHTRLIDKMGWLEYFLVTPSHHRVHHAINPKYLDKNYGQIFIIWDKIFGTFQPEITSEPPVYGITKPANTWNPWLINYQHIWSLIKDAWYTSSWKDKIRIWFMPTGWRPEDVKDLMPVNYSRDIFNRAKYDTTASKNLKIWITIQLLISLVLMLSFFNNLGNFENIQILLFGFFLFVSIFSFTSLMDGSILSIVGECLKVVVAILIFSIDRNNWFGLEKYFINIHTIAVGYIFISFINNLYFYFLEKPSATSISESESAYSN